MSRRWNIMQYIVEPSFTLMVTHAAMKWSSHVAYMQRGYTAIGGELIFAGVAGYIAYKVIDTFFEALEEAIYEEARKRRKKRRGRRSAGIQHNR